MDSGNALIPAIQCTSTPRPLSSSACINVIATTRSLRISSSSVSSRLICRRLNVYYVMETSYNIVTWTWK